MRSIINLLKKPFDIIKERINLNMPYALGWEEWEEWHTDTKAARPVAYFLSETVPKKIKRITEYVTNPYYDFQYWIRYRVFERRHLLHTRLKPGYHELDERMLYGLFESLVDFVECEYANMQCRLVGEDKSKRRWWHRFKTIRDPKLGLKYIQWEMSLDRAIGNSYPSPIQAKKAKEIYLLYYWWKEVRPNRVDPDSASGWLDHSSSTDPNTMFSNNRDPEEAKISQELAKRSHDIEEEQHMEDDEMLVRLVRLRRNLWT